MRDRLRSGLVVAGALALALAACRSRNSSETPGSTGNPATQSSTGSTLAVVQQLFTGEDPAAIRKAILQAAPGAVEIGDRGEAIRTAVNELKRGDVLLVAGKGHETGQIVGERTLPFSDQAAVRAALGKSA